MRKLFVVCFCTCFLVGAVQAQIDLKKILNIEDVLGKVMNVQRGFAPKFSLGNQPITKIAKLGEVFGLKKNVQIDKYFKVFKTGRTIYRAAGYVGGAIALYGTIKAIDKAAAKKDYQGALLGGLSTVASGLITKFLTKGASYKAVDLFNGVVRKKIGDILSVQPASSTMGMGVYVKL
jgi:hypothetical protein